MSERISTGADRDERSIIEWWTQNYWRQIRRLHKAYANLGCVDEDGSAMHYTGDVGSKDCVCAFCAGYQDTPVAGTDTA